MGIKNRRNKAILNKKENKFAIKNSLLTNEKEIRPGHEIKLSKEFMEHRKKEKLFKDLESQKAQTIETDLNHQTYSSNMEGGFSEKILSNSPSTKTHIITESKLTNKETSKQEDGIKSLGKSDFVGIKNNLIKKEVITNVNKHTNLQRYNSPTISRYEVNGIDNKKLKSTQESGLEFNSFKKQRDMLVLNKLQGGKIVKVIKKDNLEEADVDSGQSSLRKKLRNKEIVKKIRSEDSNLSKGKLVVSHASKSKLKDKVDSGETTDDIGIKSISNTVDQFENIRSFKSKIRTRQKSKINSMVHKTFNQKKIKTNAKNNISSRKQLVNAKIKEEVIKDKLYKDAITNKITKTRLEIVKERFKEIVATKFSAGALIALVFLFLLTSVLGVGNGNISTSASFVILTTDEQNQAYLDYYYELKRDLKDEIDYLANNNPYDYVVIDGLDSNGELYDLDFTEWIAILTVEIEQGFKLSNYEYSYLKTIFDKMIYYTTRVEVETSTDDEGNTHTTTTLIITVHNEYYTQIKDSLGFDHEELEWIERLIEYDSLKDRMENLPDNSIYGSGGGNLTEEEIESYGGQMVHPLNGLGYLSSPYGNRIHPIFGTSKFHSGIDLAIAQGTPIYAAQDGVVTYSGDMGGYGLTVMIRHANGVETLYAHCSYLVAQVGQRIDKGDHISNVGSTGYSTGPHVHFEVRVNGSTVNPLSFINH